METDPFAPASGSVLAHVADDGVATLTLHRPEARHAYDGAMVDEMVAILGEFAERTDVRVVILRSSGAVFSAGVDFVWMGQASALSEADNADAARRIAAMFRALDRCPKPCIALVQGACFGGGVGFVAACDIAVALRSARFRMSEVRVGLVPAIVAPYIVRAITARQARRYVLTGEAFGGDEALSMGLVHHLVDDEAALMAYGASLADALLAGAPTAIAASKDVIHEVDRMPVDAELAEALALRAARSRISSDAREGMAAFLTRRPPAWAPGTEKMLQPPPAAEPDLEPTRGSR